MDRPDRTETPSDAELRRRRRAWIREHHPDRGGDPAAFAAGLAQLGSSEPSSPHPRGTGTGLRLTVTRSRNPLRVARRLPRSWTRSRSGRPPRVQ